MTKTMKRVLTVVLVGLLAISASVLGTFSVSKADDVSDAKATFETFVAALPDPITNTYLEDVDVLENLSNARAEYLFLQGKGQEGILDSNLRIKWANLQNKVGTVITLYSEMMSFRAYLPKGNPSPAKISISRESEIGTLQVMYEALPSQYSLEVRKAIDQKVNYDYTESYYATEGTHFFKDLLVEPDGVIPQAKQNIQDAIDAIDAIWADVKAGELEATAENLGVDKLAELEAAKEAIDKVVVDDHALITNKVGDGYTYENAKTIIDGHIADAVTLANAIDTLDRELKFKAPTDLPNEAVCYSRLEDINALNDNKFTKIGETEDGYMAYFKTTHADQYDKLAAMLDHCAEVKADIEDANALIAAIEGVKYVPDEWENAIDKAQTAVDALDKDVRNETYVTLSVLEAAKDDYQTMLDAIANVVNLIALIPADITLEDACWTAIDNARDAYDALSDNYKANFPAVELAKLVAAEEDYAARKKAVDDWIAEVVAFYNAFEGATPADKIAQIWGADLDKIDALETAYAGFGADQQAYASTAKAELDAIKEKASVTNIDIMEGMIKALEPMANLGALQDAKNKYDTLHETQQELIDTTVLSILNAKWAKYQAVSYFDKAVAIIKANVEAKLYFEQDATLMNTLFVLYNVLDEEGRAMVQSYDDLVAIEVVLADAELINVYEYSNELAARIEQANNSIAQLKADLDALNAELSGKIDELNSALEKANSTATIAMVIAIIATVAAIAGIVLVFTKKN